MGALLQQIERRTTLAGVLLLDALVKERISFDADVSTYPVEDGTLISDHISQGNKRISISGLMSTADASGGWSGFAAFTSDVEIDSRDVKFVDIIEALEKMAKSRELVTVTTAQMIYEDMAFTSLTAERVSDQGRGNWLNINAELIQIRKVSLKTADVPAPETVSETNSAGDESGTKGRAGETNKAGSKSSSKAPTAAQKADLESTKHLIVRKLGGG